MTFYTNGVYTRGWLDEAEAGPTSIWSRVSSALLKTLSYFRKKRSSSVSIDQEEDLWIDLSTPLLGPASMGYGRSLVLVN